jgi:hypothetical protein
MILGTTTRGYYNRGEKMEKCKAQIYGEEEDHADPLVVVGILFDAVLHLY